MPNGDQVNRLAGLAMAAKAVSGFQWVLAETSDKLISCGFCAFNEILNFSEWHPGKF